MAIMSSKTLYLGNFKSDIRLNFLKFNCTLKVYSLTRSITHLFGTKNPNTTFLIHKNLYYKHYYFDKKQSDGIDLVAMAERTIAKNAVHLLMETGLSSYLGDRLLKHIVKAERITREQNLRPQTTRFMMLLIRYAKRQVMDVSRII